MDNYLKIGLHAIILVIRLSESDHCMHFSNDLLHSMSLIAFRELTERDSRLSLASAKHVIKSIIFGQPLRSDRIFWPNGLLALGIAEYADIGNEATCWGGGACPDKEESLLILSRYYQAWMKRGAKVTKIDDCVAGSVLLRLYKELGDKRYLDAALKIYEFLVAQDRDELGAIKYRAGNPVFADGIGQAAFFLHEVATTTDNEIAMQFGEQQLKLFIDHAVNKDSGLCYHACMTNEQASTDKLGLLGWGRATGWLMMGMCKYPSFDEEIRSMFCRICNYQNENGLFSWQINAPDGPSDTSATAMIVYSALVAGMSDNPKVCKAVLGLANSVDENGRLQGTQAECRGAGMYPQLFGHYKFGQGIGLAALALAKKYQDILAHTSPVKV